MKAVDLFAGCGGLSLGFQQAGIAVQAAYDVWAPSNHVYQLNFTHPIIEFDLSQTGKAIEEISKWQVEMIFGGPPCQDFSHAGKRREANNADLTQAFAQIVAGIRPKWFLMENVQRARNSKAYAQAKDIFQGAGYGLTERVLNASLCGVPQRRMRFFCIGQLGENDSFMDTLIDKNRQTEQMTIRDYLGMEFGVEHYYRHPRNYNRRGVYCIDEPSPTVRGVNRPIPKGYPGHNGDSSPINSNLRPLTTLERARLQTFPKNFKWAGTKTDLEQMIGNAVPVELATFVAQAIVEYNECEKLEGKWTDGSKQIQGLA